MSVHSVQDLPPSRKMRKAIGPDQRLALAEAIQRAAQQGKISSAPGTAGIDPMPACLSVTVIANQALTAAWLSEFVSKQKTLGMPWKVKTSDHFQGLLCQTCHCDAFHGSIALAKSISPCRAARSGSPGPQKPRTKGNQAKPALAAMAAIQAIKMVEPHVRMHGSDYCSQPEHARGPHSCYSKCLTSQGSLCRKTSYKQQNGRESDAQQQARCNPGRGWHQ